MDDYAAGAYILKKISRGQILIPASEQTLQQSLRQSFKILILGGGSGGISVAARLTKTFSGQIGLVEPSESHYFQPLWTLVGAGIVGKAKTKRSQASLIPKGVEWIKQRVEQIHPDQNTVVTSGGQHIRYELWFFRLSCGAHSSVNV